MPLRFEAAFRTDVQEDARRVRCSTLVVHANKDKAVHVEEGRRVASLIPGARFVELDSLNHARGRSAMSVRVRSREAVKP